MNRGLCADPLVRTTQFVFDGIDVAEVRVAPLGVVEAVDVVLEDDVRVPDVGSRVPPATPRNVAPTALEGGGLNHDNPHRMRRRMQSRLRRGGAWRNAGDGAARTPRFTFRFNSLIAAVWLLASAKAALCQETRPDTKLFAAIRSGDATNVTALLDRGASPFRTAPLMAAATNWAVARLALGAEPPSTPFKDR